MSSEKGKNEVEQKETELEKITAEGKKLTETVESLDRKIQEAKVAYLGSEDEDNTKMIKQIKELEAKHKENHSRLKKIEKKVAQAAVDFLKFFSG